jgi:Contractile injection system tube protein
LLFDVSLIEPAQQIEDVRSLTRPLFELSQGRAGTPGQAELPLVRFVWGKAWNVLGVVSAVSEQLEYFTPEGVPQRSWMRIRILRVGEPEEPAGSLQEPVMPREISPEEVSGTDSDFYSVRGEGLGENSSTERLDQVAWARYGNSSWWKLIAAFNNIDDPLNVAPGTTLRLPPNTV